jgi:hypothetical protein
MPDVLRNFLITLRTFEPGLADEIQDWIENASQYVAREMLATLKEPRRPYTGRASEQPQSE